MALALALTLALSVRRSVSLATITAAVLLLVAIAAPGLPSQLQAATAKDKDEAAVWQWSVELKEVKSPEQPEPPRAFLWIPPDCEHIRAVVVGQHNMEEEAILQHPAFRRAMSELGFAMIWITPGMNLLFHPAGEAGRQFEHMLHALAAESGYAELSTAPIVPIGHSAAASFPWNFAAWKPERTLAALSISGQWPVVKGAGFPEPPLDISRLSGVPGLVTLGEYEWAQDRAGEGLRQRKLNPQFPLTLLAEAGAGHFDVSDEKVAFLALYLKKAAAARLPQPQSLPSPLSAPVLRSIDPEKEGWLADRWVMNQAPRHPAAPVPDYQGKREEAFWVFDQETAQAMEAIASRQSGKKPQLLGYLQNGQPAAQNKDTHQQVTLAFSPLEDGVTFQLRGTFLDQVPAGRPVRWTGQPEGSPIDHAAGGGPIRIRRICGPVRQLAPDLFRLDFYRMGMTNARRSSEIWLMASHPGDGEYKRAVQQALLRFPLVNRQGPPQQISFPSLPDMSVKEWKAGLALPLHASSDAGAPVSYYVREGPAYIRHGKLVLTPLPKRARLPLKVTIIAWQWGRSIEPKLQSATPVTQTFLIHPSAAP